VLIFFNDLRNVSKESRKEKSFDVKRKFFFFHCFQTRKKRERVTERQVRREKLCFQFMEFSGM